MHTTYAHPLQLINLTIRSMDMQPYTRVAETYRSTQNAFWLIFFELIVLSALFQLFAWFTLHLTPREAMEPMVVCTLIILSALLLCGAYKWSCFESLPNMYWRCFLGFVLGTLLCTTVIDIILPSVNVFRFKFAFIFAGFIVLTTVRSLICDAMSGKDRRNRRR